MTLLARLLGLEEEASHLAVIDEIQRLIVFKEGHRMCKYAVEGLEQKIVALECVLANKGLDMVR